jgi:hypothetical protein
MFEASSDLKISQGEVPRTVSSEMLCCAVRVLEPQDTILDFPTLHAEILGPQQAIESAALKTETKCSSTEMVPMYQTALCHSLLNVNFDISCTYTNNNSTSIPTFHHTTTLNACLSL